MAAGHSTPDAALDDRLGFLGKTNVGKTYDVRGAAAAPPSQSAQRE
jgi:hypothetical protein